MESAVIGNGSDLLLEYDVQQLGRRLHERIAGRSPGLFAPSHWYGRLLDWAMADAGLRADLFRLVDVLPALDSNAEIARHAREYLLTDQRQLPSGLGLALRSTENSITGAISAFIIKQNVRGMAGSFIVGHDAQAARSGLRKLWRNGFGFTVDLLGEAAVSEPESEIYAGRYAALLDLLPAETCNWKPTPILDHGPRGPIPRVNVSMKLSAMDPLLDPADPEGSVERLVRRVRPLLLRARKNGAFINFDLEQWHLHEISYRLLERLALDPEFVSWPHLGIVLQTYLKSAHDDFDRLLALARKRGAPLTLRVVKGATWDFEVINSGLRGYPCPVYTSKDHTDAVYEQIIRRLLEHRADLDAAFGTHNLRTLAAVLAHGESLGLRPGDYEIQMLHGMAEPERDVLRSLGHRLRIYAPIGDLFTGMAYLVRRLLENTANTGFLRKSHHDKTGIEQLLARPEPPPKQPPARHHAEAFTNCPLSDFTSTSVRDAFSKAVAGAEKLMPWTVPVVIEGRARTDAPAFFHVTPNDRTRTATATHPATTDDVTRAVAVAQLAWPAWRDLPLESRVQCLRNLADRLERDRIPLAAQQVHEQAKPWREADADVAEAIDFCRYYAQQALIELAPRPQGNLPGEANLLTYEGRGVCAVIAPWNFPLAILTGMATAALVAGNAVILKPAEQASAVAHAFFSHALEAGIPPGVLAFLPGSGELIGGALVRHPDVVQIAFTGSREVGTAILRQAAEIVPGQTMIKRVVCEMGGKNAIIVDSDADLDEAVLGVLQSAFGYAGQKCSACSRVITVGKAYAPFTQRLAAAARSLVPSSATSPGCLLPSVIDEASLTRLKKIIAEPGAGAKPLYKGEASDAGWFISPALFEVTDPKHRLMQEEFFGPILALFPARDFRHALNVANDSAFALTGAVYSRSPGHLHQARAAFRVGNLYLNRGSTGAQVHRQPFGGFKMSGAGTKAGGPGYLFNFTEMRVTTENTMRRGFAPEIL